MEFQQLVFMMTVKAKRHGLDLIVIEKTLGIKPSNCKHKNLIQSDINASKRIRLNK